jgi:hypothetical protein
MLMFRKPSTGKTEKGKRELYTLTKTTGSGKEIL